MEIKKIRNNNKDEKWFDYDCMKARKNLRQLSNQKHSDPWNIPLRQHYHERLNNFKRLMKSKKQKSHSDNSRKYKRLGSSKLC